MVSMETTTNHLIKFHYLALTELCYEGGDDKQGI